MTVTKPIDDNTSYNTISRSQSFSLSNTTGEISPTKSISSSSSMSFHTKSRSEMSAASFASSRRFHSSNLGRPPGLKSNKPTTSISSSGHKSTSMTSIPLSPTTSQHPNYLKSMNSSLSSSTASFYNKATTSSQHTTIINKIAPMKELEKLIADLKKENFDLKLRLYHLEGVMAKDMSLYQLNEENNRLRMKLEDSNNRNEGLEKEIASLIEASMDATINTVSNNSVLQSSTTATATKSIGTQTKDYKEESTETLNSSTTVTTAGSFHTAFESTPEAFGLISITTASNKSPKNEDISTKTTTKQSGGATAAVRSWQKIVANEDNISSVVCALQKFKIDTSNKVEKRVQSWLNVTNACSNNSQEQFKRFQQ